MHFFVLNYILILFRIAFYHVEVMPFCQIRNSANFNEIWL
ncbi:hypothetical protein PROSTU_00300 [Providencia stuartii ATCC 25827]|uniref:Uncharacterized protein n=1 Tax=Providencia stuartii ATCC 25827 TaxID=471874 RepID=A0AA86Z0E6_PROST|nr:hypothetical protein PROSTU_00300 [Providencia stuartii ATCC 25827]